MCWDSQRGSRFSRQWRIRAGCTNMSPGAAHPIKSQCGILMVEPLGVTDSSMAAAWDYQTDDWRADLISTTHDLPPGYARFGGLVSRYYKWREGVGPVASRPPK